MANWVLLENNEIKEYHDLLPKSWRNVSGLRLSENDTDFLKSLGWIRVTKNHEEFDRKNFRHIGYNYSIVDGEVIETYKVEEILPEPEISFEIKKFNFMEELRVRRNKLLEESDWTQLVDVQKIFDKETKFKWETYRQELRDFANLHENSELTDINAIEWPFVKEVILTEETVNESTESELRG
jgi:hypothetical protein